MKKILIFMTLLLFSVGIVSCDNFMPRTTTTENTVNSTSSTIESTVSTATSVQSTNPGTTAITTTTADMTTINTTAVTTAMITTTQVTSTVETTTVETTTEQVYTTSGATTTTEPITAVPTTTVPTTTETTIERYQTISLFSMNDFHGGTYSDIENLEQIGAYLKAQRATSENTIILSNGDIFQGAALSNYYYGEPIVDVFNNIGFDGFVIGNHEFDWGIDEVLKYRDGNETNGEMSYPILAANIVYIDSQEPLQNTQPYIIKEVNGVRVGVIGLIGEVINSISASRVDNIEFLNPTDVVYDYAGELRTNQDCDIVVVYIHSSSGFNYSISDFTGDHYIDAVFNGHSHYDQASTISRSTGQPLVYAQAHNDEDSLFAEITLTYDTLNEEVTNVSARTVRYDQISSYSDQTIVDVLDGFQNDSVYIDFVSQVLADVLYSYDRYDLATWGASVIRDYAGVDIGAINSGGFRNSMPYGTLTMGDMIEIYPFDNYIKTSRLTGQQLLDFYESNPYDVYFDDSLTFNGLDLFIDGIKLDANTLYTIGAVDFIFDKTSNAFLDGQDITQTTLLMRNLLVQDLLATVGQFNPYNGTSYIDVTFIYDPSYYKDLKMSLMFN
ncbi:bifunctional UDP-sugar hydrolase/5'-nucleotidase [Mycoplasmatota bacterium WC30]